MSSIKIANVILGDEKRREKNLTPLIESIKKVGLLNPITVTRKGVLISGYYRLQAYKKMGRLEIPTTFCNLNEIEQELAKIDENLIKNDMSVLENVKRLNRFKELYEILNPNSKPEVQRQKGLNLSDEIISALKNQKTYVKEIAQKFNKSERIVQIYIQIANNLSDEIISALKDTSIENNLTDLLILAKLNEEDKKRELIDKVKNAEYKSVKAAIKAEQIQQNDNSSEPIEYNKKTVSYDKYIKLEKDYNNLKLEYKRLEQEYSKLSLNKSPFGWFKNLNNL